MKKNVIDCYELIDEEHRLSYNNVRRIEYLTNLHYILPLVKPGTRILDCACGTGAYIKQLYDTGAQVYACDLTPGHIEKLRNKLKKEKIEHIYTAVADATDLSQFRDSFFDVVLCMGPLYHLLEIEEQIQCIQECKRITKNNGKLVFAYLNRMSILSYMMYKQRNLFSKEVINSFLMSKKTIWGKDEYCFFTDSYYHTPEEIEELMNSQNLKRVKHIGSDGLGYDYESFINLMNENEFQTWLTFHYMMCEQKSMLGVSQHGLYIATNSK